MTAAGVLNINKPKGLTSHDVVARVRKITGQRKAGHTGTLDPMATGVLVLCLGHATRLIEYAVPGRKRYQTTLYFGVSTATHDAEGEITARSSAGHLTDDFLAGLLPSFTGQIMQRPPAFSAIKQGGQPLYKAARAGKPVVVDPRPVTIYDLTWLRWEPPRLTLDITCSAGTYIRSLARDLGEAAGVGAHLVELCRTANGPWQLAEAVPLELLTPDNWRPYLQPPDSAIAHLPRATLTADQAEAVRCGRQIVLPETAANPEMPLRVYSSAGQFLAIVTLADAGQKLWQPKKVFQT
ncbi:MAG: tRNA pseudouridine(55) synthase TruB [Anaerolineae bacterium]